jgi:putative ABC transport system substrate-binding protein
MRRREFIALLGGAAAAWPVAARAQQQALPTVGLLFAGAAEENGGEVTALLRGLSETGFVEGRNVAIEYRWGSNLRRAPETAADLVNRHVAVIATNATGPALSAKAATTTIPIVFVAFTDAVQAGLVTNLARPGGNVTGINTMTAALEAKRFELLRELVPPASRYGVLVDPNAPAFESDIAMAQAAAKTMGLSLEVLTAGTNREIDDAFARAVQQRVDALVINRSQLFADRRVQLTALTLRHAVPTIFFNRRLTEIGGLMSYSANGPDLFRQAGIYVGRILKGEKPADLPVVQPTKLEFVINLQTARTLGLTVPPSLLAIADEVIE